MWKIFKRKVQGIVPLIGNRHTACISFFMNIYIYIYIYIYNCRQYCFIFIYELSYGKNKGTALYLDKPVS